MLVYTGNVFAHICPAWIFKWLSSVSLNWSSSEKTDWRHAAWAGKYSHKNTYAASQLHTQTCIRGHLTLWRATLAETNTHAERGGQMESQRGLLAFHTLETWFLTAPSPSPTLFPLSSLTMHPRFHLLFSSALTFLFVLQMQPFHFAKNTWQQSIVLRRLFNVQWAEIFLKTLFDSSELWKVRIYHIVMLWTKSPSNDQTYTCISEIILFKTCLHAFM